VGTKVIYEKNGKTFNAFKFNVYAEKPLYRANVFVDAAKTEWRQAILFAFVHFN
jgi:hypothetical protein